MKIKGWVAKDEFEQLEGTFSEEYPQKMAASILFTMYKTKGNKDDWPAHQYPPVKVEVDIKKVK